MISTTNDHFSSSTHPEEGCCRATLKCAILDLGLLGQIFCTLYGRVHSLDSEESSQVGSVGGDHNEGEEPPHAGHHTRGHCPVTRTEYSAPGMFVPTLYLIHTLCGSDCSTKLMLLTSLDCHTCHNTAIHSPSKILRSSKNLRNISKILITSTSLRSTEVYF